MKSAAGPPPSGQAVGRRKRASGHALYQARPDCSLHYVERTFNARWLNRTALRGAGALGEVPATARPRTRPRGRCLSVALAIHLNLMNTGVLVPTGRVRRGGRHGGWLGNVEQTVRHFLAWQNICQRADSDLNPDCDSTGILRMTVGGVCQCWRHRFWGWGQWGRYRSMSSSAC